MDFLPYGFDKVWLYRELLLIPVAVAVLWILWLKLVSIAFREETEGDVRNRVISIEEAYLDAIINEELVPNSEEEENEEEDDKKNL